MATKIAITIAIVEITIAILLSIGCGYAGGAVARRTQSLPMRRLLLENVSAISLSKRNNNTNSTISHRNVPRQIHGIHSLGKHPYESKILSCKQVSCLPGLSRNGVEKRLLNFIAKLYTSQTKIPFYNK